MPASPPSGSPPSPIRLWPISPTTLTTLALMPFFSGIALDVCGFSWRAGAVWRSTLKIFAANACRQTPVRGGSTRTGAGNRPSAGGPKGGWVRGRRSRAGGRGQRAPADRLTRKNDQMPGHEIGAPERGEHRLGRPDWRIGTLAQVQDRRRRGRSAGEDQLAVVAIESHEPETVCSRLGEDGGIGGRWHAFAN